jgi:sugar (pentulose or hexulose) kinase
LTLGKEETLKKSPPFFLGSDIGTSSTKTTIYDLDGHALATSMVEYPIQYPRPLWAEGNPDDWWHAVITTIRDVLRLSKIDSTDIQGVSISGLAPECVPVDKEGKPLRSAILWMDRRSSSECDWIVEKIGLETVHRISGNTVDSYFGGPKWLWFKRNEPELYEKTWKILQAHSYPVLKMTGEAVTDYSYGGLCSPNFDLARRKWSEEICGEMGISIDKLPSVHLSHQVIGEVTSSAAAQTGLARGTQVVTGGGDFACSTLGAGVISPGEACQMVGTAGNLLIPTGENLKLDTRLINTVHVTGGYLTFGSLLAGGILRWFRDEIGVQPGPIDSDKSSYAVLDAEADQIQPGSGGLIVLPYFMGARTANWDPYARGVFFGVTPYHTRSHLYRSLLEGIAYAFRHVMEIAEQVGGHVREIVSVNGGGKSKVWRQIFADVLGVPILYLAQSGGAPMGDAILAAVGTKNLKDFSAIKGWLEVTEKNEPNGASTQKYLQYYAIYRDLYEHLKEDYRRLEKIT